MSEAQTMNDVQGKRLRELIRALVRRFSLAERADISCCGMTVAQAATLDALSGGGLRLRDLGIRLGIAPSTLTRNLARLEERGFVLREADPSDGRAQRVALSLAGIEAAEEVRRQEHEFAKSVLERMPHGTADDALSTLEGLLAAVRSATEACCPGAYDHLMTAPQCRDTGGSHERKDQPN